MNPAVDASLASTGSAPASAVAPHRAWLAVEAGGQGLLFPLAQAGEIFPMTAIQPVAHTQPWFLGVVNLRSSLFGVVDLAAFLGVVAPSHSASSGGREQARLLALNPELRVQCALKVDQLAGLRRPDDLVEVPTEGQRPAFAGTLWHDAQGRSWQEIDLAALARSESFLSIAATGARSSSAAGG